MSGTRVANIAGTLHEAAADAAWIQWQALGAQAAAPRSPSSIVDPEALVLFSLWLADDEPRVHDFLTGFAEVGSRVLSVQRLKRAMRLFPADADARVACFAARIESLGKDPRWRKLAKPAPLGPGRPGKVGPPSTRMGEPGSLMLRLRTAFGVDVRSDTLTYLIGRREAWVDVKDIAEALLYAKYSVRLACEALADARLVTSGTHRPVTYCADHARWTALLDLRDTPSWHPWVTVFAFVLRLQQWLREGGLDTTSGTLAASLAREFMLQHGTVLRQLPLDVPDLRDHLGEAYLPVFERTMVSFVRWLGENV
ncbi:MAG: hypothetical protein OEO20_15755 [Gemmatimonadota bacterium]|nr:hypothetical protein [Gemmatimonadota bacterium]MDH3367939.1 hypothetical protein [Gemmatimonadota bacterium]MDH3479752.1 hypothetical protein [Gemmatimonadota bacterium]MDH3570571.1 hypothetical protein [Gemmatimonadota bacterium]MDH5550813.1 hypothetical protein [Gemmatimonadota bacterium]